MAPERWTSDEQFEFLKDHLPDYSEHSRNNTLHLFWPGIFSEWATKWPELRVLIEKGDLPADAKLPSADDPTDGTAFVWTDVYTEVYQDALYLRKKRIREWMSNNRRKALGLSSMESSVPSLLADTSGSRSRGHQLREVYQRLHKAVIDAAVEDELKRSPNPNPAPPKAKKGKGNSDIVATPTTIDPTAPQMTDKGYKLKIRQAVVKRMWEEEPDEVKEAVRTERDKQNSARELVAPTGESKRGLEIDSEDRQRSLNALGPKMAKLLQEIYDLCGWSSLAILVGPNPAMGGNLSVKTFSYAHETAASATFPNVYADFNDNYLTPYVEWLKTVYPKHLRGGKKVNPDPGPLIPNDDDPVDQIVTPIEEISELLTMRDLPDDDEELGHPPSEPESHIASSLPQLNGNDTSPLAAADATGMPNAPETIVNSATTSANSGGQVDPPTATDRNIEGVEAPIPDIDDGPTNPPGGPTEPISAAFHRMGQVYPLNLGDQPVSSSGSEAFITPTRLSSSASLDPPIDPALLSEERQFEGQGRSRPHLLNFGSAGLPHSSGVNERGRGRGRGRGSGRGSGSGGGRGGTQRVHNAESAASATENAHPMQDMGSTGDSAAIGTCTKSGGATNDAVASSASTDEPETDQESHTTQCTVPSRAARARVRELNDAWKAESAKKTGKGKKAKSHLFNPDGPTPLVVLPPLDVAPRGLASERPQRERRPPKRFDGAFDLPTKRTKRAIEEGQAHEAQASNSTKRARKK